MCCPTVTLLPGWLSLQKAASCLGTQVFLAFVISDTGTDRTANDVLPLSEI